ncbi:MAG TPA: hypothetical protein VHL59_18015 [Thermoanaerobaculia bacterium]|nr:hypothetical protein [Thermoanaerobaculia bacterium]
MLLHHMASYRRFVVALLLLSAPALFAFEIPVGTPVYADPTDWQYANAVASDGQSFFVVWCDRRGGNERIFGTRMTANGDVLDPTGIDLGPSDTTPPRTPGVAWSGTSWVVVWHAEDGKLVAARVNRDGLLLGAPRAIAEGVEEANSSGAPFVASNGSRLAVAYTRRMTNSFHEIRSLLLDHELNVVGDVRLGRDDAIRGEITLATNGSEFAAAWIAYYPPFPRDKAMVEAARFDGSGNVHVNVPRQLGLGTFPLLASDGESYALLARSEQEPRTWFSRLLSRQLDVLSHDHQVPDSTRMAMPALLWSGGRYVGLSTRFDPERGHHIVAFSLDRAARPSAVTRRDSIFAGEFVSPALRAATNGTNVLTVWTEVSNPTPSPAPPIRIVATVTRAGNEALDIALEKRLVAISANEQNTPAVAFGASMHVVAWSEDDGVYATRIGLDGRSLDGRGVRLAPRGGAPSVAFDGTQFVAAWSDSADGTVNVRFISPSSGLRQEVLRANGFGASIAGGGDGSLLVWAGADERIRAASIQRATRAFAGSPVIVSPPSDDSATAPAAAWNGSVFLVVWTEYHFFPFGSHPGDLEIKRILGARLKPNLTLLDTAALVIGDVPNTQDHGAAVASNGTDWMVVWQSNIEFQPDIVLRGRRVHADGALQGPESGIEIAAGSARALTWDGSRYALAWKPAPDGSIAVGYLPPSGPAVPADRVTLLNGKAAVPYAIATAGLNRLVVAYTRIAREAQYGGVQRAFLQRVGAPLKRRGVR